MSNRIDFETFVCYDESTSFENLIRVLDMFGKEYCVSPNHNSDVDKNGELKKAHWHIVVQGVTPVSAKRKINELVGLAPTKLWQRVYDSYAMRDYLTHENDTDKFHYSIDDITVSDNFSWSFKAEKKQSPLKLVCSLIDDNHISNYYDFAQFFLHYDDEDITNWVFANCNKLKDYVYFRRDMYVKDLEDLVANFFDYDI